MAQAATKEAPTIDMERIKVNAYKIKKGFKEVTTFMAQIGGIVTSIVGSVTNDEGIKNICDSLSAENLSVMVNSTNDVIDTMFEAVEGNGNEYTPERMGKNVTDVKDGFSKVISSVKKYNDSRIIEGEYREIIDDDEEVTRGR